MISKDYCAFTPSSSIHPRRTTSSYASFRHISMKMVEAGENLDDTMTMINELDNLAPNNLGVSTGQVFEPQVNNPALGAFLFIAVVFGLLQLRINKVNDAAIRRKEALSLLRDVKARELSNDESITSDKIDEAKLAYKNSIEEEENLRTILPGIRVVAPNGPASQSDEEVAAAKQFLGVDLRAGKEEQQSNETGPMSGGAVILLGLVGLSQIFLLYILSFDPMATPTGSLYP